MSMVDFSNTEIAFSGKSDKELYKAYLLFSLMSSNCLVKFTNKLALVAIKLKLPVKWFIRKTVFSHFCGGESIETCNNTIKRLSQNGIFTILDYSVEGGNTEADYEHTASEIIAILKTAENNPNIPFTSLKMNGLARHDLLAKIHSGNNLTDEEQQEFKRVKARLEDICKAAHQSNVPFYIDAEESWIQKPIDDLVMEMMRKYNKEKAIVSNTLQMYIRDKIDYLHECCEMAEKEGFYLGIKYVRGAYLEKERARANEMGYPSPVYDKKEDTDKAYNDAIAFSVQHIDRIAICNATHNEESSSLMISEMEKHAVDKKHPHAWFSQLMGMSNHISYNLAHAGYNVTKYVPYGPIPEVMPYLIRRAKENTAMSGQMGRELKLIIQERKRRKSKE